nr:hypothetical protein Iba_chr11aCG15280 [Ipomoea batatas]GME18508.1 hypothetical protein Iba_scaffold20689CG0060 [Ipomoea batatas]
MTRQNSTTRLMNSNSTIAATCFRIRNWNRQKRILAGAGSVDRKSRFSFAGDESLASTNDFPLCIQVRHSGS